MPQSFKNELYSRDLACTTLYYKLGVIRVAQVCGNDPIGPVQVRSYRNATTCIGYNQLLMMNTFFDL